MRPPPARRGPPYLRTTQAEGSACLKITQREDAGRWSRGRVQMWNGSASHRAQHQREGIQCSVAPSPPATGMPRVGATIPSSSGGFLADSNGALHTAATGPCAARTASCSGAVRLLLASSETGYSTDRR